MPSMVDERRDTVVRIRLRPSERERLALLARQAEQTLSDYVRDRALLQGPLYRRARLLAEEQGVQAEDIVDAALAEYLGRYAGRVARIRGTQERAAGQPPEGEG